MIGHQLPKGWELAVLDDLCQIVRGITFPTTAKRFAPEPGLVACLRTANVQAQVEWDDLWFVPSAYVKSEDQYLRENDVLISTANSYELVGKVARVSALRFPSTLGAFISLLRAEAGIAARYLYYQVSTEAAQRAIREMSSTTTNISNVSSAKLKTLKFPIAPAAEQTRIVEKLEELLSGLDAGVAELKAAQKKLARYRQSLLKAAVEGALTAEWRSERSKRSEPLENGAQLLQRILTERRRRWEEKQLAKFKDQGKTPPKDWQDKCLDPVKSDTAVLPILPEGWVWARVEQLGDVQLGRQRSPDKLKGRNPTKYIRAGNITENGIDFSDVLEMDFSERERQTFMLRPGDVLLTEASGSPEHVGRPVVWPNIDGIYCFQNTVIRFIPQGVSSAFAFQLFLAWQKLGGFRKLSGGVGINHLSAGKFASLLIPLPPVEEQAAVVEVLESALASLKDQETAIARSLNQSAAQRKNFLKAAFSGELVPQDPNDEPASVLLERIRAERVKQVTIKPKKGHMSTKGAKMTSKLTSAAVKDIIRTLPNERFTFDDLRSQFSVDYDALKGIIFELLDEATPILTQEFDVKSRAMFFVRTTT